MKANSYRWTNDLARYDLWCGTDPWEHERDEHLALNIPNFDPNHESFTGPESMSLHTTGAYARLHQQHSHLFGEDDFK